MCNLILELLITMQQYLEEMIVDRRSSSDQAERHDLFSALIESSEKDDEAHRLTDEELIGSPVYFRRIRLFYLMSFLGNIFMFLVAGHEVRIVYKLMFTFLYLIPFYSDNSAHPDLRSRPFSPASRSTGNIISAY